MIVGAIVQPAGVCAACLQAHRDARIDLVVSPRLLIELAEVLRREKLRPFVTLEAAERLVTSLAHDCLVADDVPDTPLLTRDPKDDYLPALARAAAAHVLVTGDTHLLELDLPDLKIVSPRVFLALLPE